MHTRIHGYATVQSYELEPMLFKPASYFSERYRGYLYNMARLIDGVVSKSILEKAEKGAHSVDWLCLPPEEQLLPDSILLWVADYQEVSTAMIEKENFPDVENPGKRFKEQATVKKLLAPANRFEGVTTSNQLATFSKGFVPANTEANTEWAATGESLKIRTIQCQVTFCLVEIPLR